LSVHGSLRDRNMDGKSTLTQSTTVDLATERVGPLVSLALLLGTAPATLIAQKARACQPVSGKLPINATAIFCLAFALFRGPASAQEPERRARVIQVQVLDSSTGRPLLRTIMWELRWSKAGHASIARPAQADTNGVLRLDSVLAPQVQIQCVSRAQRFQGHLIADLDSIQMKAASGGDTLRLSIDGEPCDRRELVKEYGSWIGHYVPGFESSDFRICGDTGRKIWVQFAAGFWDRRQEKWPEGGDPFYPRYFVHFRGRLVGPYSYGHLGVSDYELTVDSVVFVRLASPRDCEGGGRPR
jgi:hypothetical protein